MAACRDRLTPCLAVLLLAVLACLALARPGAAQSDFIRNRWATKINSGAPELLDAINKVRAAAGAGPVQWNLLTANAAANYARGCDPAPKKGYTVRTSSRDIKAAGDKIPNLVFSVNERWNKDPALLNKGATVVGCGAAECQVQGGFVVFYSCGFE